MNIDVCNEKIKDELLSRGFSEKTIKTYLTGFKAFYYFLNKELRYAGKDDFRNFKLYLIRKRFEPKTINTYLAAALFFYRNIMHRNMSVSGVKLKQKLPDVLDREFIRQMIDKTENVKHKLLICLMYSSGMRVSEVISMKIEDLDIKKKICKVVQGKGRKDRYTILSDMFLALLDDYKKEYKMLSGYLFPGRKSHLTSRSAELVVKGAAENVDKNKHVHCHTLRHSFATHLAEDGCNLKQIQMLLGHASLRTTDTYFNMRTDFIRNVRSPGDFH